MKWFEETIDWVIFQSRWLLAPLYLGLVAALLLLCFKFLQELVSYAPKIVTLSSDDTLLAVLSLIDLVLVGNLVLLVIFAGYENFVSKIETNGHPDRPSWMGSVDMSGLKFSLIASIVAISAIQLLKSFMHVEQLTDRQLAWQAGIHGVFVVSGLLLALSDRLKKKSG